MNMRDFESEGILGKLGKIPLMAWIIVIVLIVAAVGVMLSSSVNVAGNHTAVCVTAWSEGDTYKTLGPGLHINPAYITQSYYTVSNQIQTENFVGSDNAEDNVGSITVRSSDNLELYMDFSISYQISSENSAKVIKEYGTNYVDKTLVQFGRSIPRDVASEYTALDIYSEKRATVENGIREHLIEKFDGSGITIVSFNMKEIRLPDELNNAIKAKEIAKQAMITANYTAQAAIISAQGNATVIEINANASAMAKILNANGEAEAIAQVTQMLKDQYGDVNGELYAQYLWIQALNNPNSPIQYYIIPSDGSTPIILNASGTQAAA